MGDVFDAMKRAKKEQETRHGHTPPRPEERDPQEAVADDATPALPINEVSRETLADRPVEIAASQVAKPEATAGRVHQDISVAKALEKKTHQPSSASTVGSTTHSPVEYKTAIPRSATTQVSYAPEVVFHHDRGSVVSEQYRSIRTQILARARNRKLKLHCVTSSIPGEGKSVTCFNLGIAFSELQGQKTIIVEADLRRPSFGAMLNQRVTPGLIQLLRGQVDNLDEIIYSTPYDNLQFIPAGDRDYSNSTEMLSSPKMVRLLDMLKDRYDHIFLDTPPVGSVTDASILGTLSDETILVVRLGRTPSEMVDRSKRLLRASNCEVGGVILTHLHNYVPKYLYRYAY